MPKLTIKTARKQLADAHQRIRDLQNEIHVIANPLRVQIADLEATKSKQTLELLRLTAVEATLKKQNADRAAAKLTDAELAALAAVSDLPAARSRLLVELHRRGILGELEFATGKSPPRDCTCLGSCRGSEGLSVGWRCVLQKRDDAIRGLVQAVAP